MKFSRDQAERDLRWLVDCPPLWVETIALPDPFEAGRSLDFAPVVRFLETRASHRVGYYVESLIQVWLQATPGITNLRQGIQVIEGKETRGEIDFLFEWNGELHHLEVALKFYLFCPEATVHGSHVIGPNAADTFERKRDRMRDHQLPLGRKAFPEIAKSHVWMKGMIFYPPGIGSIEDIPEGLNPDHARGYWVRDCESSRIPSHLPQRIMAKPHFLEARQVETPDRAPRREGVRMISVGDEEAETRWFVVPDEWPGGLKSARR